jgi:hypothetical protein
MANTYVDYTATAAQTDFAFNFPYLEDEHVTVEINGVATTLFTIVTSPALKVVLDSGATAGDIVRVRRVSQRDTNLVDFQNGSVLTEAELDRAYLHNRYLAEEISELNDQSLQVEAGGTEWDAKGLRIKNVGNPTDTTDASNKLYVDNKLNQVIYGSEAPLKWQFTGSTGSNTTYTVTGAEISGDTAYDVSVDGLVQEPGVDFTVNPDTDTFTIIPTLSGGEDIVIIQRGFGVAVTGTVPSSSIVNGAITTEKLSDGAVTTAKIDADAVDGSKIADDSIDSEHYVDGSIDTVHIADEAITSSKISTTDTNFNVQSDGKVGIGTASPSETGLTINTENSGVQLEIARTVSNAGSTWMGADSNGFHLGVGSYGASNNITKPNGVTIRTNGYFGVGTGLPFGLFQASTLTKQLAGTVSVSAGTSAVTGIGTNFTSALEGKPIKIASEIFTVDSVTNTTSLTLSGPHIAGASGVSAFVDDVFLLVEESGEVSVNKLNLTGLSTFADNASASSGGLTSGDVYKTSTGELRIVV